MDSRVGVFLGGGCCYDPAPYETPLFLIGCCCRAVACCSAALAQDGSGPQTCAEHDGIADRRRLGQHRRRRFRSPPGQPVYPPPATSAAHRDRRQRHRPANLAAAGSAGLAADNTIRAASGQPVYPPPRPYVLVPATARVSGARALAGGAEPRSRAGAGRHESSVGHQCGRVVARARHGPGRPSGLYELQPRLARSPGGANRQFVERRRLVSIGARHTVSTHWPNYRSDGH